MQNSGRKGQKLIAHPQDKIKNDIAFFFIFTRQFTQGEDG